MVDAYGTWKVNNIVGKNTEQDIGREKIKSPEVILISEALKGKGLADIESKNEEECNEEECNEEEGVGNVIKRSEKNNHKKENIDLNVNKSEKKIEKTNTVQGKETEEDSVKNKSIDNKKIDIMGDQLDQINKSDIKLEVNPSESKEDPKNQNKKEENHSEERTNDSTENKNISISPKSRSEEKNEKLNNDSKKMDPDWRISRAIREHCWNKKTYYLSAIGLVVSYIVFKKSIHKAIFNLLGHTLEENSSYSSDSGWTKKTTYKKNWSWDSNSDSKWWDPKWDTNWDSEWSSYSSQDNKEYTDSDWAKTNFKNDSNNDYTAWKNNPRYENYKQYFSSQSERGLRKFCRVQKAQAHPDGKGKPSEFQKIANECECLLGEIKTVSDNPILNIFQEAIIKECIK